jgi:glycosyltransferase involved in cell wall biosynthesis
MISGEVLDPTGLAVIIPALDEEEALPFVLGDLGRLGLLRTTVVVDNGSSDGTALTAAREGARVVSEARRGYGSACLRGIGFVLEHLPSTRILVFLDADCSDDPSLIPDLVSPIRSRSCDLVLGARHPRLAAPGSIRFHQRWGNTIACRTIHALFGHRYTDLGPFRAVSLRALDRLGMSDTGFGWTVEMQVKAIQRGLRVREIPVPYRPRVGRSKISGTLTGSAKAALKIGWTVARLRFRDFSSSRGSS